MGEEFGFKAVIFEIRRHEGIVAILYIAIGRFRKKYYSISDLYGTKWAFSLTDDQCEHIIDRSFIFD